jgi:hypothetical protein
MDDSYGGSPSRSAIAVMSGITTLLNFKFSNPDRQSRSPRSPPDHTTQQSRSHIRIIDGGYRRRYRSPRSAGSNQDRLRIGTGSTQDRTGSTQDRKPIEVGSKSPIDGSENEKRYTASLSRIIAICDRAGSTSDRSGSAQDRVRIESGSAVDRARSTNRHRLIRWILRSGRCDLEA